MENNDIRGMDMDLDRRWLIIAAIMVLLAFAAGVKYESFKAEQSEQSLKMLQSNDNEEMSNATSSSEKGIITIYVIGEVKNPGVFRLQKNDRVYQAVEMAGGSLDTADMKQVDMARKLSDEETVYIPAIGEISEAPMAGTASIESHSPNYSAGAKNSGLININSASLEELDTLDGIGPALAQRIIDYRTGNGSFTSIEDINNVSGIGDKKFEAIKNSITVR